MFCAGIVHARNKFMKISLCRGELAAATLDNPDFLEQWSALCGRCPWSTPYQSPAFAAVWYRVYAKQFEPILVIAQMTIPF